MPQIPLTDLEVSRLTLGCNPFGWTAEQDDAFAVLDAYTEVGGNHLDTSDSYGGGGGSEEIIGRWLRERGNRDRVVIATKVARHPDRQGLAPANIAAAAEDSLRRLGTDHIDLYYAHFDDDSQTVEDMATAFDALVREGKIRHVALSNFSPERMREWFEFSLAEGIAAPVALQLHYHLAERATFENEYAPLAVEFDQSVFSYFSLAGGFLTGKYRAPEDAQGVDRNQYVATYLTDDGFTVVDALSKVAAAHDAAPATVALAWLLAKGVTAPIASARNVEQLPALLAATTLRLTPEDLDVLDRASAPFA